PHQSHGGAQNDHLGSHGHRCRTSRLDTVLYFLHAVCDSWHGVAGFSSPLEDRQGRTGNSYDVALMATHLTARSLIGLPLCFAWYSHACFSGVPSLRPPGEAARASPPGARLPPTWSASASGAPQAVTIGHEALGGLRQGP